LATTEAASNSKLATITLRIVSFLLARPTPFQGGYSRAHCGGSSGTHLTLNVA
jgi:hypothetical protein